MLHLVSLSSSLTSVNTQNSTLRVTVLKLFFFFHGQQIPVKLDRDSILKLSWFPCYSSSYLGFLVFLLWMAAQEH